MIKSSLRGVLMSLPLFDKNIYLKMQAQNIVIVDAYLRELEHDLLLEYIENEKTPIPSTLFLAALSQMWIFATYELLRTWRQMVREIVKNADLSSELTNQSQAVKSTRNKKIKKIKRPRISEEVIESQYNTPFRQAVSNPKIVKACSSANVMIDSVFRRLTELRIALAKHEIAGAVGTRAYAPGYSRIDMGTGSIYWMVDKKDGTSEIISRRSLVHELEQCYSPKGVA